MERRIFELLWPLFGFCRYLGLFPCKQTIDPLSGSIELMPIHWIQQLTFFLFIGMPIAMLGNMAFIPYSLIEDKSIEEIFECLQNAHQKVMGESLVNKFLVFTFMTVMIIVYYLSTWGNFKTKM